MTVRDQLLNTTRLLRALYAPFVVGGVLLIILFLKLNSVVLAVLMIILWFTGIVLLGSLVMARFQCPKCGGNLRQLLNASGFVVISLPKGVRFCPFCGLRFDEEFPVEPKCDGKKSALDTRQDDGG